MTNAQVAADLQAVVAESLPIFAAAAESRTTKPSRPGAWCARQILGHLIDSACNNHRRFIVGQSADTVRFDGYDGDAWVERQRYDEVPWRDLVTLWAAYNRHLAHVMACTSDEVAARTAIAPEGSEHVTIAFLMEDYVSHLRHHVAQIHELVSAPSS